MKFYSAIILALGLGFGGSLAFGQEFATKAQAAFDQGQYGEALKLYSDAATRGIVNGHLYYNIGLAAYRDGKVGEAMAGFLAAKRYLPRDPDVAANLKFVEGKIKDRLESELPGASQSPLRFWYRGAESLTSREWLFITTLFLGLWSLLAMTGIFWKRASGLLPGIWYGLVIPVIPFLFFCTQTLSTHKWGAVIHGEKETIKVYSGPSPRESVMFELHEGAPVAVRGAKRDGFWPIEISDGKKGWLAENHVRVW